MPGKYGPKRSKENSEDQFDNCDSDTLIFRLAEVEKLRESKEPTIPTEFKMERDLNPFVRLDSPQIQIQTGSSSKDEESVCASLREMKNNF